MILYSY